MKKIILLTIFLASTIWSTHGVAQVQFCGSDSNQTVKATLANLLIRSQEADVVAGYTATAVTVAANNTTAPDGTLTAERITANAGASTKRLSATASTNRPAATASTLYRTSVYAKAGTHNFYSFGDSGDDVLRSVTVDLSNCTVGASANILSSNVYSLPDGWCRIELIATRTNICGGCANLALDSYIVTSATSALASSFTAAGTETVFIWGMAQNLATSPPDYLQTVAAAATLGPLCPAGTTQSLNDPTRCFAVADNRFRRW
jgi:hypothetical protein